MKVLKSQLAWILVNRDGPAIQPGSRSYARSWIRDGSLTSEALLRLGHSGTARSFLLWFAGFQGEDGRVPCCVDFRGADGVPENDSHGQLLFLIAETVRYTGDRGLAGRMWPHVVSAVSYLDQLRQKRRTAEYETPENRIFYGLLPESISHEGYSAKPMHSYWDDFFALRGLKDAVVPRDAPREGDGGDGVRADPRRVRRGPPRLDPSRDGAARNRLPPRLRRARRLRRDLHDGRTRPRRRAGAAAERGARADVREVPRERREARGGRRGDLHAVRVADRRGARPPRPSRTRVQPLLDLFFRDLRPAGMEPVGRGGLARRRGRRSSSATSRTPGSAPTSSAPSSTCSRTSGRRTRRSSWPRGFPSRGSAPRAASP